MMLRKGGGKKHLMEKTFDNMWETISLCQHTLSNENSKSRPWLRELDGPVVIITM